MQPACFATERTQRGRMRPLLMQAACVVVVATLLHHPTHLVYEARHLALPHKRDGAAPPAGAGEARANGARCLVDLWDRMKQEEPQVKEGEARGGSGRDGGQPGVQTLR